MGATAAGTARALGWYQHIGQDTRKKVLELLARLAKLATGEATRRTSTGGTHSQGADYADRSCSTDSERAQLSRSWLRWSQNLAYSLAYPRVLSIPVRTNVTPLAGPRLKCAFAATSHTRTCSAAGRCCQHAKRVVRERTKMPCNEPSHAHDILVFALALMIGSLEPASVTALQRTLTPVASRSDCALCAAHPTLAAV